MATPAVSPGGECSGVQCPRVGTAPDDELEGEDVGDDMDESVEDVGSDDGVHVENGITGVLWDVYMR